MTTYNTRNPIGSTAPQDLYDNAENLDRLVNSQTETSWPDRLGQNRKTWKGIEQDAQVQIDRAEDAADLAVAAAGASGNVVFAKDLADMASKLPLPDGTLIEVQFDSDHAGSRTRYVVTAGVPVFVINLDNLAERLAAPTGTDLVGYQAEAGAPMVPRKLTSVVSAIQKSILDFGAAPDKTAAQNTVAFAAAATWLREQSAGFDTPRITFPAEQFMFTQSPNWAAPRAYLECEEGTVLRNTGTGPVLLFDGGEEGVYNSGVRGNPLLFGNTGTEYGLQTKAMHHGYFECRQRDVVAAAAHIAWSVCSMYKLRCSPLGEPFFSVQPETGIHLAAMSGNRNTSACTFENPVMEGLHGYGILVEGGIQNNFIGGTSESNGGGLAISSGMFGNNFHGLDLEFNETIDINCRGIGNNFINVLSDTTSTFAADSSGNNIIGGRFNTINDLGERNNFVNTLYGVGAGGFNFSSSTAMNMVRSSSGTTLPNRSNNPYHILEIFGPDLTGLLLAPSSQISGAGASTQEIELFKRGALAAHLSASSRGKLVSWGANGLGFFGQTPQAKPTVTGSFNTNAAIRSLINALGVLGLVNDATTP